MERKISLRLILQSIKMCLFNGWGSQTSILFFFKYHIKVLIYFKRKLEFKKKYDIILSSAFNYYLSSFFFSIFVLLFVRSKIESQLKLLFLF